MSLRAVAAAFSPPANQFAQVSTFASTIPKSGSGLAVPTNTFRPASLMGCAGTGSSPSSGGLRASWVTRPLSSGTSPSTFLGSGETTLRPSFWPAALTSSWTTSRVVGLGSQTKRVAGPFSSWASLSVSTTLSPEIGSTMAPRFSAWMVTSVSTPP